MRTEISNRIGVVVVFAALIAFVVGSVYVACPGYFISGNEQLVDFYSKLYLGQPKEEVEQMYREGDYGHLTLTTGPKVAQFDRNNDEWVVLTPPRLAREWTAVLRFTERRLVATRIRIHDEPIIPEDAPRPRGGGSTDKSDTDTTLTIPPSDYDQWGQSVTYWWASDTVTSGDTLIQGDPSIDVTY